MDVLVETEFDTIEKEKMGEFQIQGIRLDIIY